MYYHFLDIEQFYADILCSTTVIFFLGVVFFDIVILPVQYLFLLGYNKLFILTIISFAPDEAEGIFGWVTFCLLFLIPGAEKFELLPWGSLEFQDSWGGHHERFPMSRAPKCYNGFFIRAQLFEGRLALNPGLKLTPVSFSCFQKHFLG